MKEFQSIYKENFEEQINSLIKRPSPIFYEMEEYGKQNKIPFLSIASAQCLNYIIKSENPNSILELGTGIGYSTIWMLEAKKNLVLTTIDRNEKEIIHAKKILTVNYPDAKLQFLNQDILEYLRKAENLFEFDFIFIDHDKVDYPEAFEICKKKCKPKTILVFDNMIWHGRIFLENTNKPSDLAIKKIWSELQNYEYEFFSSGDGLVKIRL